MVRAGQQGVEKTKLIGQKDLLLLHLGIIRLMLVFGEEMRGFVEVKAQAIGGIYLNTTLYHLLKEGSSNGSENTI